MKALVVVSAVLIAVFVVGLSGQGSADPLIEGFRLAEVASVADAMEQLTGQRAHMSHEMRPIFHDQVRGPGWTVLLKKEEHKEGGAASQGMLDAIDAAPAGSIYVMVVPDGADVAESAG